MTVAPAGAGVLAADRADASAFDDDRLVRERAVAVHRQDRDVRDGNGGRLRARRRRKRGDDDSQRAEERCESHELSYGTMSETVRLPRTGLFGLSWRQLTAFIAVVNALVAAYLHLYKLGKVGSLACGGAGGCALVQGSQWSWFLGVDVALIGAVGYTLILIVALVGTMGTFADEPWPANILAVLVAGGFLFTLRLKWAEFYMLRSFCPWCAISAVSMTLLVFVMIAERRRLRAV
jgi:uncharacterized membrane protein